MHYANKLTNQRIHEAIG